MTYKHLRIVRANPEPSTLNSGDWLRIEQPDFPTPPEGGFIAWMMQNGKGLSMASWDEYWSKYRSHCTEDGTLELEIYVYRSRLDLPYNLVTSFGELSEGAVGEAGRVEYVNVTKAKSYQLQVATDGEASASWEGKVWDLYGTEVAPPSIAVKDGVCSWGDTLFTGTLKLTYNEERTVHILTLKPRTGESVDPEKPETAYQALVRAFWGDGNVEEHEVDLPSMTGYCSRGSGSSVDPDDPGTDKCWSVKLLVDPCTKEILSETRDQMQCPEEEEPEESEPVETN